MELNHIKYFLKLAETLNFTEAVEAVGISQPALSKAVRKVEEEFGGLLVYRDGKNTRLTSLGKKIQSELYRIYESEQRARELASEHLHEGKGEVRVGIADSLGPEKFLQFLIEFREQNPKVRIILLPVSREQSFDLILSGSLDCCFCSDVERENYKIRNKLLFEERLMLAMSEKHPLASSDLVPFDELARYPYFDRTNCEFRTRFAELFAEYGIEPNIAVHSDREDWIQHLVASGYGVCGLPEYSVVAPGLTLRPVDGPVLKRQVQMISVFGSSNSPTFRKLEQFSDSYSWD